MTNIELLEKWSKCLEYDKDQTTFDLNTISYDIHKAGDTIKTIINEYDPSGNLAVVYAKNKLIKFLNSLTIKLIDLFTDNTAVLDLNDLFYLFSSKSVKSIERNLVNAITNIADLLNLNLISDRNISDIILDDLSNILEELHECKVELVGNVTKPAVDRDMLYNDEIEVYNTLAECILRIETYPEGIYLNIITDNNSLGAYFAYIIKKNGRMICINDRVQEEYRGQHKVSRNGRWTDSKKYNIFPYHLFEYSNHDYKGYATKMTLEDKQIPFHKLGTDAIDIVFTMYLLMQKFDHLDVDTIPRVYSENLLSYGIRQLNDEGRLLHALTKNSLIVKETSDLEYKLLMTDEDIVNSTPSNILDNSNRTGYDKYKEFGDFDTSYGHPFIDLYGEGFEQSTEYNYKLLGESNSEIIGTAQSLYKQKYIDRRHELFHYISAKMAKEYEEFGGIAAIDEWWRDQCRINVDKLLSLAVEKYISNTRNGFDMISQVIDDDIMYSISTKDHSMFDDLHTLYGAKCPIYSFVSNIFFNFRFRNYSELLRIVDETAIPRFLIGYHHDRDVKCNPLLDAYDPIAYLGTPVESRMRSTPEMLDVIDRLHESKYEYRFQIAVGLSKRGLNTLVRQYKEESLHNTKEE